MYMTVENKEWARNLTKTEDGIFRTTNGNADELIGIGRTIKAGFSCSRVDITNGKYDAIVDVGNGVLLRIQIKGVGEHGSVSFTGGGRSGQQINRAVKSRTYKYTVQDIDVLMAVDSRNGECYIIPVKDLKKWGITKSLSTLGGYKENWKILIKIANEKLKNN
jgi:hypothetical protein